MSDIFSTCAQHIRKGTPLQTIPQAVIDSIRQTQPTNEVEYLVARWALWAGDARRTSEAFAKISILLDQGEDFFDRWITHKPIEPIRDIRHALDVLPTPGLVLLGEPGAGKTTQLRKLEVALAVEGIQTGGPAKIPFCISLSEYGRSLSETMLTDPFEWLNEKWRKRLPTRELEQLVASGKMVFLIDGLNEMPHRDLHDYNTRAIAWRQFLYDHVRDRPGNRAIFACRTLDYAGVMSTKDDVTPVLRLEPLTPEQILDYACGVADASTAEHVVSFLLDRPEYIKLFRNPLMLNLLLWRAASPSGLPANRAEALAEFVRDRILREVYGDASWVADSDLLNSNEKHLLRSRAANNNPYWLPAGNLVSGLSELAFAMQVGKEGTEKGQVITDRRTALSLLEPRYQPAVRILKAGCDIGVLEEREGNVRFYHQLVQEFFAARRFAEAPELPLVQVEWEDPLWCDRIDEILSNLAEHERLPNIPTTGWEETVLLAIPQLRQRSEFLIELVAVHPVLCSRILLEPGLVIPVEVQKILWEALWSISSNHNVDLRARVEVRKNLGRTPFINRWDSTGRDSTIVLHDFVHIPSGEHSIGSDQNLYPAEGPRHMRCIPSFKASQYPVTNQEFGKFIEAGGYEDDRWWRGRGAREFREGSPTLADEVRSLWFARRKVLQRNPRLAVELLKDRRATVHQAVSLIKLRDMSDGELNSMIEQHYGGGVVKGPALWDDETFNNPLQPVVGLSWYEASAYCRWLSFQTGTPMSLLTEYQWEALANGVALDVGSSLTSFLNTSELRLWNPTPVGVLPETRSHQGVFDLLGNVFEWTCSKLYPYQASVGTGRVNNLPMVCRGGSFRHGWVRARPVYRGRGYPYVRNDDLGFRICS